MKLYQLTVRHRGAGHPDDVDHAAVLAENPEQAKRYLRDEVWHHRAIPRAIGSVPDLESIEVREMGIEAAGLLAAATSWA